MYRADTPGVTDKTLFFSDFDGFRGPVIKASYTYGDTSGSYSVALMIARLFPTRLDFVERVERGFELRIPRAPFADDLVSRRTVESQLFGKGKVRSLTVAARNYHGAVLDEMTFMVLCGPRRAIGAPTEIEFMTPGGKEGTGTTGWLKANADPIHGLVMLLGDTPNMLRLSMRIPGASAELRSAITQRLRADSKRYR